VEINSSKVSLAGSLFNWELRMSKKGPYTAYGVEPHRRATYELRQSRYVALASAIELEAQAQAKKNRQRVELLDVGVSDGITLRYLEPRMTGLNIGLSGVDLFPLGLDCVYRLPDWKLHRVDLEKGMPSLPSASYDIVVCEQVLEHLHNVQGAIRDLHRVLRPGGLMIVGVPIFPFGLHKARTAAVRAYDRLFGPKERGHVQAWSLRSFLREFSGIEDLHLESARGFRIVSGGILRPLEFTRQWWLLNRWIGAKVPSLCTEVQVLLRRGTAQTVTTGRENPSVWRKAS
jgi:SAM-dependent methyltransferase